MWQDLSTDNFTNTTLESISLDRGTPIRGNNYSNSWMRDRGSEDPDLKMGDDSA